MTTRDATGLDAPSRWGGLRERLRRKRRREPAPPLTFAREKRLLLGALALLVALPFPMNEPQPDGVVSWAVLLFYSAAVALFLVRTKQSRELAVPAWAMNVAGLLYLPLFLFRLRTIGPTHIARPMIELLMFGLVMRLFGMQRERDKWYVSVLLFFLFVAAMATSVHPLILLYLLAAFVLWLMVLMRFLQLHLEQAYPLVVPGSRLKPRQLLAVFAGLTLLGALPFFALLPRLRTPYIMGGAASRQTGYSTGFRDQVTLDVVGNIRESPAVALRLKPEDPTVRPPALLRGTTYDQLQGNVWLRSRSRQEILRPVTNNLYRLAPGDAGSKIRMFLEPIDTRSLILPLETLTVEVDLSQRLYRDIAGVVMMLRPRDGLLEYRVGVSARPVARAEEPRLDDPAEPTLDRGGITPRIEDLAKKLAGDLPPAEAAQQIHRYLVQNMAYSLDFLGRDAKQPIEDFLFKYKSGHCEYFATAMILMLRSVGIPARLVTGFLGSEFNPLEDYYIVRQSNAHAWVEAWLPESGWTTLDPTPPAGRPEAETRPTVGLMLRQAWDYLEFRWDRYVMSYGFFDQAGFMLRFRDAMRRLMRAGDHSALPVNRARAPRLERFRGWDDFDFGPLAMALTVALVALAALLLWRARSTLSVATRSYRSLRATVARRDSTVGAATGPIALARWVDLHAPSARGAAAGVIDLYLLESFRGGRLGRSEKQAIRRDLRQVRKLLRRERSGVERSVRS